MYSVANNAKNFIHFFISENADIMYKGINLYGIWKLLLLPTDYIGKFEIAEYILCSAKIIYTRRRYKALMCQRFFVFEHRSEKKYVKACLNRQLYDLRAFGIVRGHNTLKWQG